MSINLLAELKRRNVIRMGGLYLVGAWLIIQVAETLLPVYDTPGWVLKALILLLALGFIPALTVSWLFELTPEGLKRDKEVDRSQSIAPRTGQRMNVVIAVLLSLGLAWYVLDKFVISPTRDAVDMAASLKAIESEPESAPSINLRSIAVLPFENLSEDKANGF
ncbi:hypothetical protein, partial [Dokdonella sp.]|uniref:hypothetical protein n=1 Tax=Dokdonella sp. TaxID=2291710 RepID=UPI003C6BD497